MTLAQALLLFASLAFAVVMLRRNVARALVCLMPSRVAVEIDAPADAVKVPAALASIETQLRSLGFARLGSHHERRWGQPPPRIDFAQPTQGVFASAWLDEAMQPRVDLLTPAGDDGFVVTSSYRRGGREEPGRYFAGGLEQASIERVYRAHLRRVPLVGAVRGSFDQPALIAALQQWYRTVGARELRRQNVPALVWAAFSVGLVAAAAAALLRG